MQEMRPVRVPQVQHRDGQVRFTWMVQMRIHLWDVRVLQVQHRDGKSVMKALWWCKRGSIFEMWYYSQEWHWTSGRQEHRSQDDSDQG